MEIAELYNLLALAALLICKVIIICLIFFYCCRRKTSTNQSRPDLVDIANQTEDNVETAKNEDVSAIQNDIPPSYSALVLKADPPEYLDSILNEELNPELNPDWSADLENGEVKPEVAEVITRSRHNSIVPVQTEELANSIFRTNFITRRNSEATPVSPHIAFWIGV